MSFCQIQILGNCGRDAEMTYTPDGTAITKFSVAVSEKVKDGKEATVWYSCTAFRSLAEMLGQHLKKGSTVFVQGKLTPRQYTTKDGRNGLSLDVVVDKFSFCGSKPNGAGKSQGTEDSELGEMEEHPF